MGLNLKIIIIFLVSISNCYSYDYLKKNSIEGNVSSGSIVGVAYIYTENVNRLNYGLEAGIYKGLLTGGTIRDEIGYEYDFDYSKLTFINLTSRFSYYIAKNENEYDMNGLLLLVKSGFQYINNTNKYQKGMKSGFYTAIGIEYIYKNWSGSIQNERILNDIINDNYIRLSIRYIF